MKNLLHITGKVLLSLILVMPILGTLGVFPPPTPDLYNTALAFAFIEALMEVGYINYMMSVVLVVALVALWSGREALAALIITPITANVVAFHLFIDGGLLTGGAVLGNIMLALNLYLLWRNRAAYAGLLVKSREAHHQAAAQPLQADGFLRSPKMKISVATTVSADIREVWRAYTTPEDINAWNAASDDWHTTATRVDLREGGAFSSRMEAKDGSKWFDFAGTYTRIVEHRLIEYYFGDRQARVEFSEAPDGVGVKISFDAETTLPEEMQRQGWQSILNNFKKHVENRE